MGRRQKTTILVAVAIVTFETALIVALFRVSRRRREAQRMLEQSDELKGSILHSLRSLVAVLDRDGVILTVNDAWREYVRATGEASLMAAGPGTSYLRLFSDRIMSLDAIPGALEAVQKACRGERSGTDVEYQCLLSRDERWFLMAAEPLRRPEGGAVVTHIDITARKRDEIALRESEDRFRRLADALPLAVWMSDGDAGWHYVNRQWLELTGLSLEGACGSGWLECVHPDDRDVVVKGSQEAFRSRRENRSEFRVRRADGEYRWMLNVAIPRYGSDGAFHGYVGSCLDITARREAEHMLRDLNHRLIAAQEDERARIARELHDHISQQLALLAIDLQQLSLDPPQSSVRLISALHEEWRRTTEIASDIHAISYRLHPSKLESLGLVKTLRSHCRDLSRQTLAAHFFEDNVPASLSPEIALCLFRVAEEALTNVARHSGAHEAHVSLVARHGELVLCVQDAGNGFAEVRSGGIGLVSMRQRLDALGGRLSINSVVGRGTLIEAFVPMHVDVTSASPVEEVGGTYDSARAESA